MSLKDTPREKLIDYLKNAKTKQTAEAIAKAIGVSETATVNLLNALRTEKIVVGRPVNKSEKRGVKKMVTEYEYTGEGIAPPSDGRPAIQEKGKPHQSTKRSITHDLIKVMEKHPPQTEFRAEALTSLLNIETPSDPVTSQLVAQRLSSMTGLHIKSTRHKIPAGEPKRPGGRDYFLTYSLLKHPGEASAESAAKTADAGELDHSDSEGGLTDVTGAQDHPVAQAMTTAPIACVIDPDSAPATDAPILIAVTSSSGAPADDNPHLDDIRHVMGLPDDMPNDKLAEAIRWRVASLNRRVQDMQNQMSAVTIALQQANIDVMNQTQVEGIMALNDTIKVLKAELDKQRAPVPSSADRSTASVAMSAIFDLQSAIAGTGATLTVRDGFGVVGVLYQRNRLAVTTPGKDLIDVLSAIRTLNQHTPHIQQQEAA